MKIIAVFLLFALGVNSHPWAFNGFRAFEEPWTLRFDHPRYPLDKLAPRTFPEFEFPHYPFNRRVHENHIPEIDFLSRPHIDDREFWMHRVEDQLFRHPFFRGINDRFFEPVPIIIETERFIIQVPEERVETTTTVHESTPTVVVPQVEHKVEVVPETHVVVPQVEPKVEVVPETHVVDPVKV